MITYPLHLIYKGITSFRNYLFNKGILKEFTPEVFTIGVGNLTVGGTGKTPLVNFLCRLLKEEQLGVISRGYGRKTKGFLSIIPESTPDRVGDEPLMMALDNPEVRFFVSEDRVRGYNMALQAHPEITTFIFDDVFQHRYLRPHVRLLLSDYHRPFYNDHVLPYGRLRETRRGAGRADAIIITKCPENLADEEKQAITAAVKRYSRPQAPVFFAIYSSHFPVNAHGEQPVQGEEVVLVSALADNGAFFRQQEKQFTVKAHFAFRDHYRIPLSEIRQILAWEKPVITTSKDFVKIRTMLTPEEQLRFYVPEITVEIDNSFSNYIRTRPGFV